jgi:hypothetical protein
MPVTLKGATTLVNKTSAFILSPGNLLSALELLKM